MGDRWNEGRGSAVVRGRGEEFVRKTEKEEEEDEGACGPECRSAVNFARKLLSGRKNIYHSTLNSCLEKTWKRGCAMCSVYFMRFDCSVPVLVLLYPKIKKILTMLPETEHTNWICPKRLSAVPTKGWWSMCTATAGNLDPKCLFPFGFLAPREVLYVWCAMHPVS